jgi:hypothetical protein
VNRNANPGRLPVRLQFGWQNSEETTATIVDIFALGISVHCEAPLLLGMEVTAVLEGAPDDLKVYRVVGYCEAESADHGFNVGVALHWKRRFWHGPSIYGIEIVDDV